MDKVEFYVFVTGKRFTFYKTCCTEFITMFKILSVVFFIDTLMYSNFRGLRSLYKISFYAESL